MESLSVYQKCKRLSEKNGPPLAWEAGKSFVTLKKMRHSSKETHRPLLDCAHKAVAETAHAEAEEVFVHP